MWQAEQATLHQHVFDFVEQSVSAVQLRIRPVDGAGAEMAPIA